MPARSIQTRVLLRRQSSRVAEHTVSSTRSRHSGLVLMTLLSATLFVLFAGSASAQTDQNASSTSTGASTPWQLEQCLGGLTYGAPLKLAASWAGGLRKELSNGQDVCAFISPKVGLGGARLGAGFARTTGTFGGGYAGSVAIIRTFGAPSYADRMSTYAGGSLHYFPLLGIGLELGWYKRLGGPEDRGRKSIISWSLGIGF